MLGYTKRSKFSCVGSLQCEGTQAVAKLCTRMVAYKSEVQRLELACRQLHTELEASRISCTQVIQERDQLIAQVNVQESALAELRGKLFERSQELVIKKGQYKRAIEMVNADVLQYKDKYCQVQDKMKSLANTPFGWQVAPVKGTKELG